MPWILNFKNGGLNTHAVFSITRAIITKVIIIKNVMFLDAISCSSWVLQKHTRLCVLNNIFVESSSKCNPKLMS